MSTTETSRELFALELVADGTLIASGRDNEFGHVAPDERVVRYVPEDTANTRAALESIVVKLHKLAGMRMSHEAAEEMRNILGTLGVALKD